MFGAESQVLRWALATVWWYPLPLSNLFIDLLRLGDIPVFPQMLSGKATPPSSILTSPHICRSFLFTVCCQSITCPRTCQPIKWRHLSRQLWRHTEWRRCVDRWRWLTEILLTFYQTEIWQKIAIYSHNMPVLGQNCCWICRRDHTGLGCRAK